MCCLFAVLVFLGPRVTLALWWLLDQARFNRVFDTFFLPVLGFLFLPFTTLMWVLIWDPSGISAFGWIFLGIALLFDLSSYGGSAYGNRDRVPGYSR
ncbi:MAG: hypothetical protein U0556_11090 [Dehalococcoidia bacterium]